MKVIKANKSNKDDVLKLLDDFRTFCAWIMTPSKNYISTSAKDFGWKIFDEIIDSNNSAIFLVEENNNYIWISTIHKIPQIRRWEYCAEIEEMFISDWHQGKWIGLLLINEMLSWAEENNIKTIRLESDDSLVNAHKFYIKAGFKNYWKAFEKKL